MPLVEIRLLAGRTAAQKKRILSAVTEAVRESSGAPLDRIRVWITDLPPEQYMVAGVTAADRDAGGPGVETEDGNREGNSA